MQTCQTNSFIKGRGKKKRCALELNFPDTIKQSHFLKFEDSAAYHVIIRNRIILQRMEELRNYKDASLYKK